MILNKEWKQRAYRWEMRLVVRNKHVKWLNRILKRLLDLSVSLIFLCLFSPLYLVIAIMVRTKIGSPVLFRQERAGLNGKPFTIYKFRTMTEQKDVEGNLLPDEKRLVPFGVFLRKTSLDEIPEFFNVLKGEMSLVGPRPLLVEYLERYSPEQKRRHLVKPGITGWAQINGRNLLSWEERFKYDLWYVDNWNILLDLKILFITLLKVFKREGINAEGYATMPEFKGGAKG